MASSSNQTVAIVGGLAVLVAIAGGAYFFVLNSTESKQAEHSTPIVTDTTVKPSAPAAGALPAGMPEVEFVPTQGQFTVAKPTAAYIGPVLNGPQMYPLDPGIPISIVQQSKDKAWVISVTEDGKAAYIPTADLGPYDPNAQANVPVLDDSVSGTPDMIDTATLTINGQRIPLFGIVGKTGKAVDDLQDYMAQAGASVTCNMQEQAYVCMLPNGVDVARLALYHGLAEPGPEASDDYRQQAESAKSRHEGVWK
jgi:hypothetical protein